MPPAPGSRLGPYQVLAKLGEGGMGEVWKARDTKLGREVAIKTLPEQFAADAERLARFEREAKLLASLNHPNIGGIYGLEESDGTTALILELVEGETLADRLQRGPIPVEDALTLALQIAQALEAAHEKGVIHRDLKPANVMIQGASGPTPTRGKTAASSVDSPPRVTDGTVKVLDFGLAKAFEGERARAANVTNSPTLSMAATQQGIILGTAAYMSPEQAKGRTTDKRTDIWAFGAVLFEMLTGRQSFGASDVSEALAAVIRAEPDWQTLPQNLHPRLREVLERCLTKDVQERIRDIGDVAFELRQVLADPLGVGVQPDAHPGGRRLRAMWAAMGVVLVVGSLAAGRWLAPGDRPPETRLDISAPVIAGTEGGAAISPDGRRVIYVAPNDGVPQLWVRTLDVAEARLLAGTENAVQPFWSPDSGHAGFFADGALKRVDVVTGGVQIIVPDVGRGDGGTWNAGGVILYASDAAGNPLQRTLATGGEPPVVVTDAGGQPVFGVQPTFLPDGRHFLYYDYGEGVIWLGDLEGDLPRRLIEDTSPPAYSPQGYVLFVRGQGETRTLYGQPFDAETLRLGDGLVRTADAADNASASDDGSIAYIRDARPGESELVILDRSGGAPRVVRLDEEAGEVQIAPGQDRVVIASPPGTALRTIDLGTGREDLLFAGLFPVKPLWSPTGLDVVFVSAGTDAAVYRMGATGTAAPEVVLRGSDLGDPTTGNLVLPSDWSPDGRHLLLTATSTATGEDIWAWNLEGEGARRLVVTPFDDGRARFSQDGEWVAYESNRNGSFQIFVARFDDPGIRYGPVSIAGGSTPKWAAADRELFYVTADARLMSVPITLPSAGAGSPEWGAPEPVEGVENISRGPGGAWYDVSADGQQIVMIRGVEGAAGVLTVILNWDPGNR